MKILGIILIVVGAVFITIGALTYNYMIPYVIVGIPTRYAAYGAFGIGVALIILGIVILVKSSD